MSNMDLLKKDINSSKGIRQGKNFLGHYTQRFYQLFFNNHILNLLLNF